MPSATLTCEFRLEYQMVTYLLCVAGTGNAHLGHVANTKPAASVLRRKGKHLQEAVKSLLKVTSLDATRTVLKYALKLMNGRRTGTSFERSDVERSQCREGTKLVDCSQLLKTRAHYIRSMFRAQLQPQTENQHTVIRVVNH
jgi:hypothetical protein